MISRLPKGQAPRQAIRHHRHGPHQEEIFPCPPGLALTKIILGMAIIIYRMSTWQLDRSYKLGQLQAEAEAIEIAIHKAFASVSFEVNIYINQPNPMNHLVNEFTAYVDIPATATKEDSEQIDWTELKFVQWSEKGGTSYIPTARPLMGYIPRLILEKYDLKSCCFRSSNVCVTQECDQRPTKPIVDRKRKREESHNDAIESELKKLESKMQSTLCYAYTTGQARAHNQTPREHANQAAQQHTPLTPAPTLTHARSAR